MIRIINEDVNSKGLSYFPPSEFETYPGDSNLYKFITEYLKSEDKIKTVHVYDSRNADIDPLFSKYGDDVSGRIYDFCKNIVETGTCLYRTPKDSYKENLYAKGPYVVGDTNEGYSLYFKKSIPDLIRSIS